jgi:hypothetical protein
LPFWFILAKITDDSTPLAATGGRWTQAAQGTSMKKPAFWKLSMSKNDFHDILEVIDWLRQGLVLANRRTKKKGSAQESQGEQFVHSDRDGDYFYLCHGNRTTTLPRRGIILLGRFTGPPVSVRHHRWVDDDGWAGRRFEWTKTAISPKKLTREHTQQWTPRDNSTFIKVRRRDLKEFESVILKPYFDLTFSKLALKPSDIDAD